MKAFVVVFIVVILSACTTPAEEDEPSNNAAPVEDAGGETPDASVSDVEDEEEISSEICLSITDPVECRSWSVCTLINFYPMTIEDGQCVLSSEASEQICTGAEMSPDSPFWIWVRFNEDGAYDAGLVHERAGNDAWQRCHNVVDVPECACDAQALWDALREE